MTLMTPLIALMLAVAAAPTTSPSVEKPGWKLVWSDEFDKPGAPDPAKWVYETNVNKNHEKQIYTKDRPENVRIEDGCLIIESRKEPWTDPEHPNRHGDYTSGSIETFGLAEWTYGRIEARAKVPTGVGTWPAFWMLGKNIHQVGWPACGEIDIMENVGFEPDTIYGTIHTKAYNHVKHTEKGSKLVVDKPYEQFHVYAVEWDDKKMDFFVDDQCYFTFKNDGTGADAWPFSQPFYLKLNTAIGGDWGGRKGIDDSIFPQKFYIDYVRVYQRPTP